MGLNKVTACDICNHKVSEISCGTLFKLDAPGNPEMIYMRVSPLNTGRINAVRLSDGDLIEISDAYPVIIIRRVTITSN